MKQLLSLLLVCFTWSVLAQAPPVVRQRFSTNVDNATIPGPTFRGGTNYGHWEMEEYTWKTNSPERKYNIKAFGAVIDGRIANNCYVTNGSTVLTTTTAAFGSTNIGKIISIYFAGTNTTSGTTNSVLNWTTGISNVVSSTVIVLSNAPVFNATNVGAVFGTDDSAAWQSALNFFAVRSNSITLFHPGGISIIGNDLQDVGNKTNHHNAQIYIPSMPFEAARAPVLTIQGVSTFGGMQINADRNLDAKCSVIWSTLPWGPNGTNYGSVFDCRATDRGAIDPTAEVSQNGCGVLIDKIHFRACFDSNLKVVNLAGAPVAHVRDTLIDAGYSQQNVSGIPYRPLGTNGTGLVISEVYSDNNISLNRSGMFWFYNGLQPGENLVAVGNQIMCCARAIRFHSGGGNQMFFFGLNMQECGIYFNAGDINATTILSIDAQIAHSDLAWTDPRLVVDPSASLCGVMRYTLSDLTPTLQHTNGLSYTGAVNMMIQCTTLRNSVPYGPFWQSPVWFHDNVNVRSTNVLLQTSKIYYGSDTTNVTRTASSPKYASFFYTRRDQSAPDSTWGSIYSQFDNFAVLQLGFGNMGGIDGAARGVQRIRLMTSSDVNTSPSDRWYVDSSGDFMPAINETGDFVADSHNIASATYPMNTNFMNTLSATNIIYNGTTNTVGTTVAGQVRIILSNGRVGYLDIKF